ncbi:SKP1-like protein 1 [Corylus avellana]|uniref:SKP1-like protein 1 n=1 Tax=Corylus avellana TaxID=13451 RepID=UPI001E20CECC|nr:SKP1-like protein 1 [Corylus avellana]
MASPSKSSSNMVKLKASDDKTFEVEEAVAVQCGTLKNMVDDGYGNDTIPLPNVDGKILGMVLEWCKKHVDDKITKDELSKYEDEFVEVDQVDLYDLLMAANYLLIQGLLDRVLKRVADLIKGKQPEEIRKIFNIKNDFTPEEEEEIRKKNAWAFA